MLKRKRYHLYISVLKIVGCFYIAGIMLMGCATHRTRWNDPKMRVSVWPVLDTANTIAVQSALMKSEMFSVVDRNVGFISVVEEQNIEHRIMPNRFDNYEKFAHWGKLHGVGSVIIPYAWCEAVPMENRLKKRHCSMNLSLVDANTGAVIVSVAGEGTWRIGGTMKWGPLVEELEDAYPKTFNTPEETEEMLQYRNESERRSHDPKED